ncbi:MAG: sigma 54-interacting transcriptional regulator, partial [Bradymonadaceae bacterium]
MDRAIVERFYRLLAMNEVILSTRHPAELWQRALDTALSLSGAERGYLLVHDPSMSRVGAYRIVASRDIDGESIPKPHLKVSLTIAEEAARTGQTVVTINAQQDGRFHEALSVVDLDLTSVLCVPLRDGTGLLGALYLDHRFQPGVFDGEVPRMMEAFGHQIALAITNTRHIEALGQERARLAEVNERLDALLLEREGMVVGLEQRCARLAEEVELRRASQIGLRETFPKIAFTSKAMEAVLGQVERVAQGDIPVVVTGESGVGKELVARAVHDASPRRNGPFIAFNCGAISENLIESELFGHEKGAFTGAESRRVGLFQAAHGGTIFLDEVGEMPLTMQVKLLRTVQEGQVRRIGATSTETIDVRIVAATNRDLNQMVDEGTFREDLYWRLAAIVIEIPPLRDRPEDIPLIAQHLLENIGPRMVGRAIRLRPDGARLLSQARWAGNVRELENLMERLMAMTPGDEITVAQLPDVVRSEEGDIPPLGHAVLS